MADNMVLDWMKFSSSVGGEADEKENYLKVIRGEEPDWVPLYFDACDWVFTGFMLDYVNKERKFDIFNVEWEINDAGKMPKPDRKLLEDVTKWREFVNFPDTSKIDWEQMAAEALCMHNPNKAMGYRTDGCGGNFFIPLMNMMGFEEGLCALLEEPEAVDGLFDAVTVLTEEAMRHLIPIYKPDVVIIDDDMAAATNLFISTETFRNRFRPFYQRLIDVAKEFGLPVELHMCGCCEKIIPDFVEMGVNIWQPAQVMNDLKGIKARYGNRLVLNGGWDSQGKAGMPGASEEVVRQSARTAIDNFAVGGGYVFWDLSPVGNSDDMLRKIAWVEDEARKYGRQYYRRKDQE